MLSPLNLLDLASRAAETAAGYIRSAGPPSDPADWTAKGAADFVTQVDRTAERRISDLLLAEAPESTIVGEELSPDLATAGLVWIVDPLDGTTNFLHRYPMYAVSIAAAIDGVLQAGVVVDVAHDVHYHASLGGGATANGRPIRVSGITDPRYALIGTGFPFKQPQWLPAYQRQFNAILPRTSGVRRTGSAALDLAAVAAGCYDGFWELMLAPWDIAAGLILVREAGGTVSNAAGQAIGVEHTAVVAGNETIHAWLLDQLGAEGVPHTVDLAEERHP